MCCEKFKQKHAKKILSSLVKDEKVEKHSFCEAICVSSNRVCMKRVDSGTYCRLHDPKNKCHGMTVKGDRCKSAVKVGEDYCHRHRVKVEKEEKSAPRVIRKITKENLWRFPLHPDYVPPEVITHKSKHVSKSRKHTSKDKDSDDATLKKKRSKSRVKHTIPFKMDPGAVDLTLENLATGMFLGWVTHPTNSKLECATNYTINGKCIVKMPDINAYVGLYTPEQLWKNGDYTSEINVQEDAILNALELRPLTSSERERISGDKSEQMYTFR